MLIYSFSSLWKNIIFEVLLRPRTTSKPALLLSAKKVRTFISPTIFSLRVLRRDVKRVSICVRENQFASAKPRQMPFAKSFTEMWKFSRSLGPQIKNLFSFLYFAKPFLSELLAAENLIMAFCGIAGEGNEAKPNALLKNRVSVNQIWSWGISASTCAGTPCNLLVDLFQQARFDEIEIAWCRDCQ